MTPESQETFSLFIPRWMRGNAAAVRLAAQLIEVAHFVDDLVDGDFVPPASASRLARIMLLEIPSNAFYRENFDYLQPLLAQCWLQWSASNVMENEGKPGDRAKCYMLRASLYGLLHGMTVAVGGLDWAEEVGPEIYRAYGETMENFDA